MARSEPAIAAGETIRVEVVRAWPRRFESKMLDLPAGAAVGEALTKAGWRLQTPSAAAGSAGADAEVAAAIFGERVPLDHVLSAGDRIEWLRPLRADPKDARRRRAKRS